MPLPTHGPGFDPHRHDMNIAHDAGGPGSQKPADDGLVARAETPVLIRKQTFPRNEETRCSPSGISGDNDDNIIGEQQPATALWDVQSVFPLAPPSPTPPAPFFPPPTTPSSSPASVGTLAMAMAAVTKLADALYPLHLRSLLLHPSTFHFQHYRLVSAKKQFAGWPWQAGLCLRGVAEGGRGSACLPGPRPS